MGRILQFRPSVQESQETNENWRQALRRLEASQAKVETTAGFTACGQPLTLPVLSVSKLALLDEEGIRIFVNWFDFTLTTPKASSHSKRPALLIRVPQGREWLQRIYFEPNKFFPPAGRPETKVYQVATTLDQYLVGRILQGRTLFWEHLAQFLIRRCESVAPSRFHILAMLGLVGDKSLSFGGNNGKQ